jgi:hypothetical protein
MRRWGKVHGQVRGSDPDQLERLKQAGRGSPCEQRAKIERVPHVPARDRRLRIDKPKYPICREVGKPSGGLEPQTPSLPSSDEAGSAGKRGLRRPPSRRVVDGKIS